MFPVCFVKGGAGVCTWGACAGASVPSISIAALQVGVTSMDIHVGPLWGF